jgi:hypothetical protein
MTKNDDLAVLDENPQTIIGVTADATPEEIRAAYLNKIKEYPPEKFPAEFERVRDAYAILSDARYRSRLMLQSIDPAASLETLLDHPKQTRHFVGPEAWLAAMRER